mgnify:CR=1 FL=1
MFTKFLGGTCKGKPCPPVDYYFLLNTLSILETFSVIRIPIMIELIPTKHMAMKTRPPIITARPIDWRN